MSAIVSDLQQPGHRVSPKELVDTNKEMQVEALTTTSANIVADNQEPDGNKDLETNEDYQLVQSALKVLKRQLDRAQEDLRILQARREEALKNPVEFVQNIISKKNGEKLPTMQQIVAIPTVDLHNFKNHQRKGDRGLQAVPSLRPKAVFRHSPYADLQSYELARWQTSGASQVMPRPPVRGEARTQITLNPHSKEPALSLSAATGFPETFNENDLRPPNASVNSPKKSHEKTSDSKRRKTPKEARLPASFNQPWSLEEQSRLEELLEIYPEESVQAHRYEKIAKALGTRNARQVASRVQKYFMKLTAAGLPLPGAAQNGSTSNKAHNEAAKPTKPRSKPTSTAPTPLKPPPSSSSISMFGGTFSGSRVSGASYLYKPTVYMSDDESDDSSGSLSDDDLNIDPRLKETEEYKVRTSTATKVGKSERRKRDAKGSDRTHECPSPSRLQGTFSLTVSNII
ncbi:ZZ-type zinc finger-containing protein 3 [Quaeritorhiza haematococci]|nr:ZZ-type zinc finger-containing protein 3 [Quaeritorhiza haematococci]